MLRFILLSILFVSSFTKIFAQNDTLSVHDVEKAEVNSKKFRMNGYIKYLNSVAFPKQNDEWLLDNQIHNRLKFRYQPIEEITIAADVRTRFFYGKSIKTSPLYIKQITNIDDYIKLGGTVFQEKSLLLHTVVDRSYIDWQHNNWQITLGKQRVNWGKSYVWNPNDIFNAYSFSDFDYEERPGTDAILIRKYFASQASVEFVSNINNKFDKITVATLFKFNKNKYDFQFLAGKQDSSLVVGTGWAGQLKDAGFKGELSYFQPYKELSKKGTFIADVSVDYAFANTLNFRFEAIVNNNPAKENAMAYLTKNITAKTLINNYFSVFGSIGYDISPLFLINLNSIYNVDNGSIFLNPTINFSLNSNTELFFSSQILAGKKGSLYEQARSYFFTRLKWSF